MRNSGLSTQGVLFTLMALCAAFLCNSAQAQNVAISTNALDYANLGALNAEVGVATGRHFSLSAGAVYNPWTWGNAAQGEVQNRQRTFAAGIRWWPWNIWSGWWMALKGQYREYNSNLFSQDGTTEEGNAFGASFSIGYAIMLSEHFNLDFGAGFWGGSTTYTTYACPRCGKIVENGVKGFIRPNDLRASIVFIF